MSEIDNVYRTVFDHMLNGAAYCHMLYQDGEPNDFVYLAVNRAFEAQTGLCGVVGKKASDSIPGIRKSDPKLLSTYARVVRTGKPEQFEIHVNALDMWFHLSVYSPAPEHFVAIFDVISERKRASEELKRLSDRLLLATSAAGLGIWDWDVENNIMIWDDQMLKLYGLTKDTFPGGVQAWQVGLHPEDRELAMEECQCALRGEKDWDTEFRVLHPDGRILHLKAQGLVLRDADGKAIRMLGVNADITDQKRAAAELVAAKAAEQIAQNRTRFLELAAHELRNPLTGMSLLLQLVQRQLDNGHPVDPTSVARLREPVDRLTRLVSELLDLARLDRGRLQLRLARIDISALISGWLEDFQLQASGRPIVFIKPTTPTNVDLDSDRINQVLANILDNAVHHARTDTPIEIRVETLASGVRVSVTDYGEGIPEGMVKGIFDPASRTSLDADEPVRGLGLGLSICRGIVELHGGNIGVQSQIGAGSTFYFELPSEVQGSRRAS